MKTAEENEMHKYKFAVGATFIVEAKNLDEAEKLAETKEVEEKEITFLEEVCMKKIKKIRCPKCNSEQGYSRIKTEDRVRNCGKAYKPE